MKYRHDKTLKVGDIVTCYYKGYWKIIDIESAQTVDVRGHQATYIRVTCLKLLDSNMNLCKHIQRQCSIYWCKRVQIPEINNMNYAFRDGIERLTKIIEESNEKAQSCTNG